MIVDFRGKELSIGDNCIYLKNVQIRKGSNTICKLMFEDRIIGFTKSKVIFKDDAVYGEDVVKLGDDGE